MKKLLARFRTKFRARADTAGGNAAGVFDPDERWSNQYREREKNNIYKWVGVRAGGELLAVYERDGEEGVLQFAQEKMESMMYNEGQHTQLIKFADYVRWKKAVSVSLGVPTEEAELNEAQSRFHEHEAQWRLNKRGMHGETLVHLLLNRQELVCQEVARILIAKYPGLAKDIYLGEEFFGQSCLHLAIVHDDYDTVQVLLEYGASVNARATGDFFMPDDVEPGDNLRATEYNGYAYYGEFPLAFAACFENKDIYDLLIQYGANPDNQDMFGNTTLHMCVIHDKNAMYSYAVRHWQKPGHTHIVNFAGQTPLTLATKLGRHEIFQEMMELMKVEFWRFSDMTCSAYPLDALDSIQPDGSTNYDSALMTVVNGGTSEHLEMINSEVIQRLLADKWKAFAERKLIERLALLAVHLLSLCLVVYLRPAEKSKLMYYLKDTEWWDWVRAGAECVAVASSCWFVFVQQMGELRTQGLHAYVRNLTSAPSKIVYMVSNVCLLACVPLRFYWHREDIEDALMAFAFPGSWAYLLFFARTTKLIGPFVQMIYTMIAGDLLRFGLISTIFMIPFSQTMFFLGKDIAAKQKLDKLDDDYCDIKSDVYNYDTFLDTFMTMVRICMNGIFYEELACGNYQQLMKGLFVLFIFLMFIMMITILIAMINNTYIELIGEAELTWRQQRAKVVMVIERGMDRARLAACQLDYSVRMNEPGREARGLMVIKQTNKTRAQQRKQALANWKTIGRKVITMAKELGTLSTRYLLHSHDRLVNDDTVSAGGTSGRYGNQRPYTAMGGGSGNASAMTGVSRRTSQNQTERADTVMEQYPTARRRSSRELAAESQLRQHEHHRRPSVPQLLHNHHPRLSIPGLALMDQSALRKVVTHATVNSMKLKQAQEAAQKQKALPPRLAQRHHHRLLHTHSGMANAARRMLHDQQHDDGEQRGTTAENDILQQNVPQSSQVQDITHVTHTHLQARPGVHARGVHMLPSVDVPNMPATATTWTTAAAARRHTGDSHSLSRSNSGRQLQLTQRHHAISMEQPATGDAIPLATMASSTLVPPSRRVRADLFRAKNSPPVQLQQNAKKGVGTVPESPESSSSTTESTASTAMISTS